MLIDIGMKLSQHATLFCGSIFHFLVSFLIVRYPDLIEEVIAVAGSNNFFEVLACLVVDVYKCVEHAQ